MLIWSEYCTFYLHNIGELSLFVFIVLLLQYVQVQDIFVLNA
jgi:hypothetical protein